MNVPNGTHHQIDYIILQDRYRSEINRTKTRTFLGADVKSGKNFRVKLKNFIKTKKKTETNSTLTG